MNARRSSAIVAILVGLLAAAAAIWVPHPVVLYLGVVIIGFGLSLLWPARRRNPELQDQDQLVRQLWSIARRLPSGVHQDPLTGQGIGIERERGFLTITTVDPPGTVQRRAATVTSYPIGFLRRPMPAPVHRQVSPLFDNPRLTWRQARAQLRFNQQTGALDASTDDLTQLLDQLRRSTATAGEGTS